MSHFSFTRPLSCTVVLCLIVHGSRRCIPVRVCVCVCVCARVYNVRFCVSRSANTAPSAARCTHTPHRRHALALITTHFTTHFPSHSTQKACPSTMSHHHTYYVTSSYILCHIIIHTNTHTHRRHALALDEPQRWTLKTGGLSSPCRRARRRARYADDRMCSLI